VYFYRKDADPLRRRTWLNKQVVTWLWWGVGKQAGYKSRLSGYGVDKKGVAWISRGRPEPLPWPGRKNLINSRAGVTNAAFGIHGRIIGGFRSYSFRIIGGFRNSLQDNRRLPELIAG
jgi:hypothetical protein